MDEMYQAQEAEFRREKRAAKNKKDQPDQVEKALFRDEGQDPQHQEAHGQNEVQLVVSVPPLHPVGDLIFQIVKKVFHFIFLTVFILAKDHQIFIKN